MKMRCALLAAALALVLAGCQAEKPSENSPSLPPETASALSEGTPSPLPETPVPSEEPETSPALSPLEQLLAQSPIDDTHDAFLVDTGGRLGTLLVTAERGEQDSESWEWEYPLHVSVWNPEDMSQPIQELEGVGWDLYLVHEVLDANFDGHMDFSCVYSRGNGASCSYLWIWDEETGQFVEVPEYREISWPRCNPETGIIDGWARNSGGGDGVTTFHRWEDGELVCVRRIETGYDDENRVYDKMEGSVFPSWIRVEDRIDGELTEVYYRYFAVDEGTDFFPEQAKWENLDYHGET